MSIRKALAIFLILISHAAYGLDVTVSAGNQDGSISVTTNFAATTIDNAEQDMKLNPVQGYLENHLSFTGSGSTSREVGTTLGPRAKTGFTVSGKPGYTSTSYEFSTSFTSTYARSWMDLSSYKANSIGGYGWAQSSSGTPLVYVNGRVNVQSLDYTANLVGYTVNAQAWTSSARIDQDYYSASTSGSYGYISPYVSADVSMDHTHKDKDYSSCVDYLRSSSTYSANSPYTTLTGLNGGYKGYAYANQGTELETTWQDIYGRGSTLTSTSQAYSSDLNKFFVDSDVLNSYGIYHLMQQDTRTTSTSGYASNTHYL